MSEEMIYHTPLATHFETQTFGEMGIYPSQIIITSRHQPTELKKTGIDALIAKLPKIGDDTPVAMDIDIACALYDEKGNLLDSIWYGNVRTADESVRHHGDTFIGMNKAYRPSLIEESITVRLLDLHFEVHRLAFFVHSHNLQPLQKAALGEILLSDNNNNLLHQMTFAALNEDVCALCAWQMIRTMEGDWRVSAPMAAIKAKDISEVGDKWHGTGTTLAY